ncbi:hypothetical protein ACHAP9_007451 [Verticillium nonalfalfae]
MALQENDKEKAVSEIVVAKTIETIGQQLTRLAKETPPFYKSHSLFILHMLIIPGCLMPAVTLGFDAAIMNDFDKPRGAILRLLNAVIGLCCIVATPFISFVADRWGRRFGIFFGAVIMLIGGVIQGASINIAMFVVSRFIIDFGLVFANTYAPMLIGELAHPKDRQVITSLYQTSWYLGAILFAWTDFLFKYHCNGDDESPLADLEYREMRAVIEAEIANNTGWRSLLKTPGNRRRILVLVLLGLFSQWSGNGLVSYYLVRVLETAGINNKRHVNITNGCLMIFN